MFPCQNLKITFFAKQNVEFPTNKHDKLSFMFSKYFNQTSHYLYMTKKFIKIYMFIVMLKLGMSNMVKQTVPNRTEPK